MPRVMDPTEYEFTHIVEPLVILGICAMIILAMVLPKFL